MVPTDETHTLLILSRDSDVYLQILSQAMLPGLSIVTPEDVEKALWFGADCDLLFGEPSLVSKVINYLPMVRWVQSTWAGVEPLFSPDLRRDYILTNARNVYGSLMSEYVFGYLLSIERRILTRWVLQQQVVWDETPSSTLRGKLLGLLGVGTIGDCLAKTAHYFGMSVNGYTRQSESCPYIDRYFHPGDLRDFASGLDYLVCTLPGTPNTSQLIDETFLSYLPQTAWLLNVGRGSVVDESALVAALSQGRLAGAVLDVFMEEPLASGHPLWQTPNTFITAHTAATNYPPDIAGLFIENYKRLVRSEPLLYQVDFNEQY
jgi:phosphoglycerate dehydrogenase-like enzyme